MEYYPSVSKNGSLYFGRNDLNFTRGDIHISRKTENGFALSKKLSSKVNLPQSSFNAFISPDETFILLSAYVQNSSRIHSDLFISFKDDNHHWNDPINLGAEINSKYNDISPWISYDNRFLFFLSTRLDTTGNNENYDIFWVNMKTINTYRQKNLTCDLN